MRMKMNILESELSLINRIEKCWIGRDAAKKMICGFGL